ncbi:MAG: amidophosphoribosyltransferase [Patescibacteria group bacterium]|nr:amidophosphoribosyltransferase [Patescibacteria group bacterium]
MKTYPKHYCGIFGIKDMPRAAEYAAYGLHAIQHRGQESAGIASTNGDKFFEHKGMGLVLRIFDNRILSGLEGQTAIGHNRYATTGKSELKNAQPLSVQCKRGGIALAHNGNLTNTKALRTELENHGVAFQTTTDSEIMLALLAQSDKPLDQAILDMMSKVEGAYSLVIMTETALIAVRDPHGFRPLSLGTLDGNPVIASETCAFDIIGARFEREVEPGEIVIFESNNVHTQRVANLPQRTLCAFEKVYFDRPDSKIDGQSVYGIRFAFGERLAKEYPIQGDIVVPILDGGKYAALGYAKASGIQLVEAFVRNHYEHRSFIQPNQSERDRTAEFKLNLIPELVRGKRVIIIDDSIVRGTTCKSRIKKVREAGAHEVHVLVSCPPHIHPCYYGIDFPDQSKLIAANNTQDEIRKKLDLDSLGYLSMEGFMEVLGQGHCLACWNGNYPTV